MGAPGATVSFVAVVVRAEETLPAASAAVAEMVTEPSGSAEASMPERVSVPAPCVAGAVALTETPLRDSVTVTTSVETEDAPSVTRTETEPLFAGFRYALPVPPPLARATALGRVGADESARAVAVELSMLCSPPVETARTR